MSTGKDLGIIKELFYTIFPTIFGFLHILVCKSAKKPFVIINCYNNPDSFCLTKLNYFLVFNKAERSCFFNRTGEIAYVGREF
jgi:hypothetical protein